MLQGFPTFPRFMDIVRSAALAFGRFRLKLHSIDRKFLCLCHLCKKHFRIRNMGADLSQAKPESVEVAKYFATSTEGNSNQGRWEGWWQEGANAHGSLHGSCPSNLRRQWGPSMRDLLLALPTLAGWHGQPQRLGPPLGHPGWHQAALCAGGCGAYNDYDHFSSNAWRMQLGRQGQVLCVALLSGMRQALYYPQANAPRREAAKHFSSHSPPAHGSRRPAISTPPGISRIS